MRNAIVTCFFMLVGVLSSTAQRQVVPESPDSLGTWVNGYYGAPSSSEVVQELGADFETLWYNNSISENNKLKIWEQSGKMLRKGYSLRGSLKNYIASIVHALNSENLDAQKFNSYLLLADNIVEAYPSAEGSLIFGTLKNFFQHRAIYYQRSNQLFVFNDSYTFDFVAPPVVPEYDPEEVVAEEEDGYNDGYDDEDSDQEYDDYDDEEEDGYFDEWEEEDNSDDWDSDYNENSDEALLDAMSEQEEVVPVEGVVIRFDAVDLNFVTKSDSTFLRGTKGDFVVNKKIFVGEGGKFDWTVANLPAEEVYATLGTYNLDVSKPRITSEKSKLSYPDKINAPVDGVFEFASRPHDDSVYLSTYPRFMSFTNNVEVKNLGNDNIKYHGGFALKGAKILSSNVLNRPSTINYVSEVGRKYKAISSRFEIGDSLITSEVTAFVIYHRTDSIYHPAVRYRFNMASEDLEILKDKGGFRNTPYYSTFYKMNILVDRVTWNMQADSLDMQMLIGRHAVPAYFESESHFNIEDFRKMTGGQYNFHPLKILLSYSRKNGPEFYVDDVAKRYKIQPKTFRGAMVHLMQKGFIDYDYTSGLIKLKPKSKHYYNAQRNTKDYDNIILDSRLDHDTNATLNLAQDKITVRGVESITIMDSLDVFIQPDSAVITILKNRDFIFDGKIFAGNFHYVGRDFLFSYDSFLINLNHIDSIRMFVKDENSRGNKKRSIDNAIVGSNPQTSSENPTDNVTADFAGSSGVLYINDPRNKSGRKKYTNYPKFTGGTGSVVKFDRGEYLGGVYDNSIFFDVPPFDLDSLNDSDPSAIKFAGAFNSNGIFPVFEEKLRVMEDFSLGFDHDVPAEGYQLYKGDGTFYNTLRLDKKGIQGSGRIDYLTSTFESENLLFYPDSVTGTGTGFDMLKKEFKGQVYPDAQVANFDLLWKPKEDEMVLTNIDDPFTLYDKTANLQGELTVKHDAVEGNGELHTRGSVSKSDFYSFQSNKYLGRHAEFKIESDDPEKPALAGDDVRLRFNLEENYADISPEIEGEAAISFPYAQFKTSITNARWDLSEHKVVMTKEEDAPIESSFFYSTAENLDSLVFNGEEAVYDINTQEINVKGIPYIIVADAKITPSNNELLIGADSKIGTLENAEIILDTLNGYHRLHDAVIDIQSRNEFSGYALYEYVNALNDTFAIEMRNFRLEEDLSASTKAKKKKQSEVVMHSVANGTITEEDLILVSPGMYFKGDIILYANKPALQMDGFVKLNFQNTPDYNTWIQYNSSAEQQEVVFNFDNSTTDEGRRLNAGLHFSSIDNTLYSTFVQDKEDEGDDDFFKPGGLLHFDEQLNEFVIEDTAKSSGEALAGRIFGFNEATGALRFEGLMQPMNNTKGAEFMMSGIGTGNVDNQEYKINTLLTCNFSEVPSSALDQMAIDMMDVVENTAPPEGLGDFTNLLYKLGNLIGERPTRVYDERSKEGYVPLAGFTKELTKSLNITNLDLEWSSDEKAFYSVGKIGLSNIKSQNVNAAFDGFLEFKKNDDGTTLFNLFIKAASDSWYYFSLENNRLLLFSSNGRFNGIISDKTNATKAKVGEMVFYPGDRTETLDFINRFRLVYLGIDDPYDLSSDLEEEEVEDAGFGGAEDKKETTEEEEDDDDGF